MQDVVIIGKGPAGVSAALYICRAALRVTLIGKDLGALGRAGSIDNYYGLSHPLTGPELAEAGLAQARALGAEIIDDEVFGLGWDDGFVVTTQNGEYRAHAVIVATGAARKTPPLAGLSDYEGRGVSYCAVCDGFFFRGREVAVMGAGEYALHEAEVLLPLAAKVTLLTNGEPPPAALPEGLAVVKTPLSKVFGDAALEGATLSDGGILPFSGLFLALGSAAAGDLARRVGAELNGARIVVDEDMATAIPGLFAAGDCAGKIQQVSTAVADGARAGLSAIRFVRTQKKEGAGHVE